MKRRRQQKAKAGSEQAPHLWSASGSAGAGLRATCLAHCSNFLLPFNSPGGKALQGDAQQKCSCQHTPLSIAWRSVSKKRCESTSGREQHSQSNTLTAPGKYAVR